MVVFFGKGSFVFCYYGSEVSLHEILQPLLCELLRRKGWIKGWIYKVRVTNKDSQLMA